MRCMDWPCTVGWPAFGGLFIPAQLPSSGSAVQTRRTACIFMTIRLRLKSCARACGGVGTTMVCGNDVPGSAGGRDKFNDLPGAVRKLAPVQDVLPRGVSHDFEPDRVFQPAA